MLCTCALPPAKGLTTLPTIREYATLDATALADLIRRKEVTAAEVVEAAIHHLERAEPHLCGMAERVLEHDLTGWLWTGLIERISQDRRSWTCGEVRRRVRSRWC